MTVDRQSPPSFKFGLAILLTSVLFLTHLYPFSEAQSSESKRPNIVIIMADDLGFGDISPSPYNGWIKTPALEQLAEDGVRFSDYHSNGPVCSPTRAALMTGRYQQRASIPGVVLARENGGTHTHGIQDHEYTFAEALSDAGYTTAMLGKWHLGYYRPYNPTNHGFDFYRGFVSGNIDYFAKVDQAGHYDWWNGTQLINERGYVPHLLTEHATEFIENQSEKPFFLYVAHTVPHYPYQGPDDNGFRVPGRNLVGDPENNNPKEDYRKMVKAFDRSVGRIRSALKRKGLTENTFLFICSDNGASGPGSNGSLRGSKGNVFEGGHRVPAIAYYPGHLEPGTTFNQPVMSMDLMPTAVELADASLPEDLKLDGINIMPALTGKQDLPERNLMWEYENKKAFRRGPWKLVLNDSGIKKPALFHLGKDPGESNNLAPKHPERVKQMKRAFKKLRSEVHENAAKQPDNPPKGALEK